MRYHRINIDGCSLFQTETRLLTVAAMPGTAVRIDPATDKFVAANGTTGVPSRLYVLDAANSQGLSVADQVPANVSAIGNYLESDREFAVLMAAGTYVKDQPVVINASGQFASLPTGTGAYNVVGYVQENDPVTISAPDLIRIRVQLNKATVA